jgi:LytS/YehU family sensor histidine kinase
LFFCVVWAVSGKLFQLLLMIAADSAAVTTAIEKAGDRLVPNILGNVASWILTTLPFGVVVYVTVAGVAHAISYFTESKDRELQLVRLGEQLASARYAALQSQLNPHFLFNTLNTIAVLVRDGDRDGAVSVVENLSDVLRKTLRRGAHEVSLGEELELVKQYLAIEQARFSDRLQVSIDVDASLHSAAVPNFAVQHLVENAIRHGIARDQNAGVLRVNAVREKSPQGAADTLVLTVTDDGPGVSSAAVSAFEEGRGLANTRERLRVLHGDAASLALANGTSGGAVATLRVPFRESSREPEERSG